MQRRYPYKGFIIEAHPYKLRDLPGWSMSFNIEHHDGSGVTDTPFFFKEAHTFDTEEAAIQAAILAGKQKIDAGFTPSLESVLR